MVHRVSRVPQPEHRQQTLDTERLRDRRKHNSDTTASSTKADGTAASSTKADDTAASSTKASGTPKASDTAKTCYAASTATILRVNHFASTTTILRINHFAAAAAITTTATTEGTAASEKDRKIRRCRTPPIFDQSSRSTTRFSVFGTTATSTCANKGVAGVLDRSGTPRTHRK